MPRPATIARIEEAHRYSSVYRGTFANHLPMALVALDAMGASEAQLERFTRAYAAKLEPIDERERERVDGFQRSLAAEGFEGVLAGCSAAFAAAIGSAAFHGAIRLAYAIESTSVREQAHALAYWSAALNRLPDGPVPQGTQSPLEVLQAVSRDAAFGGKRPPGAAISVRMAKVAREPAFATYVAQLDPARLEVRAIASALIRAYAATGDFTLLHGVTGCHAFRILAPYLSDPAVALRSLWIAVAAAYMASGSPEIEGWRLEGSDALTWPEIHARAAECDDEHDVKFAYSCWREWQSREAAAPGAASDDRNLYRRAASARVCHALAQVAAC